MSSIGPTPPPSSRVGISLSQSQERKNGRSSSETQIREEQRRLGERMADVKEQMQTVEREGQVAIESAKEAWEAQAIAEGSRQEKSLESEKLKGYERIRSLQRDQAKELARVKREGESDLAKIKEHYRGTIYANEQEGENQLRDMHTRHNRQVEYELNTGGATVEQIRKEQALNVGRVRDESTHQLQKLEDQAHQAYEEKSALTQEQTQKSAKQLEERYLKTSEEHQETLARLTNQSARDLQQVRLDTARKLAAYSERQNDPFYQMMDTQAQFEDAGEYYILSADIPEHERHNVNIAIRGNQVMLTGSRRNQEKVELEPGRVRGTNSYQSFTESFTFEHPVDSRAMTREFDGDTLIVTIPKKSLRPTPQPYKAKPEKLAVQKPDYPANLPHVGDPHEAAKNEDGKAAEPTSPSKSTKTLA